MAKAKVIPTGAEWKLLRQNTYKLPKGVGPSLGKTLDAYHTTKKQQGATAGLKALAAVKKMVKDFRTSKKVLAYYNDHNQLTDYSGLQLYFVDLLKRIEERTKTLQRYEAIAGDVTKLDAEDILKNRKLCEALAKYMTSQFSIENLDFVNNWNRLGLKMSRSQVAAAMDFIDKYIASGIVNGPKCSEILQWRARETELQAAEAAGDLTLWKQLFALLVPFEKAVQANIRDAVSRLKKEPDFPRVLVRVTGGEKALKDYDKAKKKG